MFSLVKVCGTSMSPTLNDGDYIITKKPRSLRPGFIYVVNHIDLGLIVKRLDRLEGAHAVFSGDNKHSLAASLLGKVEIERVQSRALIAIHPKGVKRL